MAVGAGKFGAIAIFSAERKWQFFLILLSAPSQKEERLQKKKSLSGLRWHCKEERSLLMTSQCKRKKENASGAGKKKKKGGRRDGDGDSYEDDEVKSGREREKKRKNGKASNIFPTGSGSSFLLVPTSLQLWWCS